uniref:Uncharacterized protein n=1 Tax=Marseillevirus LCMAC202 TaxID=2506606 RepID=A0A481YXY4_9VIRU|nr:MAG: hypothetical protein LCMAC202_04750 [Marseillevirus LCMAC202]
MTDNDLEKSLIGMSLNTAVEACTSRGLQLRVIRLNDISRIVHADYRSDRVNVALNVPFVVTTNTYGLSINPDDWYARAMNGESQIISIENIG